MAQALELTSSVVAPRHVGSHFPNQGSKTTPPALEGRFITAGMLETSQDSECLLLLSLKFWSNLFCRNGWRIDPGFIRLLTPYARCQGASSPRFPRGVSCPDLCVLTECDFYLAWVHAASLQSCLSLCDPLDSSLPGFSVHGILQAKILEWVAMPSSGDLPHPGIKPRSPALQMDSLPSEPPGKPT